MDYFKATPEQAAAVSELRAAAEQTAKRLNTTEAAGCSDAEGCLRKEAARPGRGQTGTRRAFNAYDPDKLCDGYRAYWFAEMAAAALRDIDARLTRIFATERRAAHPDTTGG